MPFDIVLVDDHKLVRDGVRTILERGTEFRVVGEAENGSDAVALCRKSQPDMVLMDIGLPGMNGIEATTELLRHCPTVKVVILSMYDDENSVVSAIRSGARAFVLKKASSNELLDALPVQRVVMPQGSLREIFVGWDGTRFTEITGEPSTPALARYFGEQGIALEEGQQAEVGLEACDWIENAGRALERGFVLTIDYGHEAPALYSERHNRGTLLAYREHAVSENTLEAPGEQDLTAHVNFTALDLCGRRAGLARAGLVTQSQFLVALGRGNEFADLYDPAQTEMEKLRARLLLKNLIHPEGLGEKFQVLIQSKGIVAPQLTGLQGY